MSQYVLTEELRSALINYLAERPIKEALGLFAALQKLQPLPPQLPEGMPSV